MRATSAGLLAGVIVTGTFIACSAKRDAVDPTERMQKANTVTQLWTQIRGWRHEAGLPLDPPPSTLIGVKAQGVKQIENICPDGTPEVETCSDICSLSDAICDNAEAICTIADELKEQWSTEKCTSAKASCKEAKQRCCKCNASHVGAPS